MPRNSSNADPDAMDQLVSIAENYDSKVRLLFQLRNYISLVKYNPLVAKRDRTSEFRRFVTTNELDIWDRLQKKADTRKVSKRVQSIKKEVEDQQYDLRQSRIKGKRAAVSAGHTSAPVGKRPHKPTPPPGSAAASSSSSRNKRRAETPPATTVLIDNGELQVDADLGWPDEKIPTTKRVKHNSLITHPLHYIKPQFNGSLDAYLNSFRTVTDDIEPITADQWEKKVDTDVSSYKFVEDARASGKLARLESEGVGTQQMIPKFTPPIPTEPSYHENMLTHIIHYAKLRTNLRKFHQSIVKRNTQSVEQYFRRLAGAEDRERKELDRQIRQIARKTSQEVMKKWRLAEKIVEQRHEAVLAEEKREKGKEYLNQILDKSAKLIESRIGDLDEPNSSDEDAEDDGEDADGSEDDSVDETPNDSNDAELTLEQLREKYKNLPDIESETENGNDLADSNEDDKPSEEALRIYAETKGESGESESVSSSDESGESDSESQSNSESEDDAPKHSLASLLGGNALVDDDDDAEISEGSEGSESEKEVEPNGAVKDAGDEESEPLEPETMDSDIPGPVLVNPQNQDLRTENPETENPEIENPEAENPETENPEPENLEPENSPADHTEADHSEAGHPNDHPETEVDGDTKNPVLKKEELGETTTDVPKDQSPNASDSSVDKATRLHRIEPPFLLKGHLREYQRNGLDWLAGLVQSGTNGILADEMGLGKTIQTIALLSWLACERHVWGPHLIVVPTSVMLNWEMEFKRFAPGFKILTYFGTPQQRKRKRRGWNKEDTWHVCITSYQLVIQDQIVFRGKRWQYMVLDEAHNIKNFRSQRWQALLNFNAQYRLLLTGTPLQNNLVELWSLLYFLMPSTRATQMMPAGFASLDDFQEWFAKPVDQMVEEGEEADDEARATITKLHQVLRPYLLRRLKIDVEKQMPGKYEHVVYCRLSKRQRYLYDDFMARASTKATLQSGNFMSILNCLMQLRKVCNHPDLFEVRPIVTSFTIDHHVGRDFAARTVPKFMLSMSNQLDQYNLVLSEFEHDAKWAALTRKSLSDNSHILVDELQSLVKSEECENEDDDDEDFDLNSVQGWAKFALYKRRMDRIEKKQAMIQLNNMRTNRVPLFGTDCISLLRVFEQPIKGVLSFTEREQAMHPVIQRFAFVTPPIVVLDYAEEMLGEPITSQIYSSDSELAPCVSSPLFHEPQVRLSVAFPDKRLLQYDCGKLQKLAILLRDLISGGHRCLIFTQMTRVLDILEQFLNLHGWRYLRLDGATRIEQRQALTERFNKDSHIPVFILSTRSGGLGINLTGADTVIFYDSDWNPAMDRQCQDRCHRIGQTRDVHIYRLVSEFTIESNILRKATQKTILDNVVIQEGDFTTEYFSKLSVQDILGNDAGRSISAPSFEELQKAGPKRLEAAMAEAEDRDDQVAANLALSEARMDQEEFSDSKPPPPKSQPPQSEQQRLSEEPLKDELPPQPEPEPEVVAEIGHIDDWMIHALEHYNLY